MKIDTINDVSEHPCFSAKAAHKNARIHLPVAKNCNVGCNYCNRKYDCMNESRPGVCSEIISPEGALERFQYYKQRIDNLKVVGIAGPGEALANWEETSQTINLIRAYDPKVIICMSTNGLKLPGLKEQIVDLGISHVTVTVNAVKAETAARIYRFVNYKGKKYTGTEGAQILLNNQLEGISYLTRKGIMVKANIVMIPGINEDEIPQVVQKMKAMGVFITNIMPLIPVKGSAFADFPATDQHDLMAMRRTCQTEMRQMFHCQQCRADAVGLLNHDCGNDLKLKAV